MTRVLARFLDGPAGRGYREVGDPPPRAWNLPVPSPVTLADWRADSCELTFTLVRYERVELASGEVAYSCDPAWVAAERRRRRLSEHAADPGWMRYSYLRDEPEAHYDGSVTWHATAGTEPGRPAPPATYEGRLVTAPAGPGDEPGPDAMHWAPGGGELW